MMSNAIDISNIKHKFGKKKVLDGFNLEIPKGEAIALLGANGSGKTTLIQMMTGLLKPDAGEIKLFGENPLDCSNGFIPGISFVSEKRGIFPWMTVGGTLKFARNITPDWDCAEEKKLLSHLKLRHDQKTRHLSRGEHGKLVLLMALASKPKLLIMDEPTEGLDPLVKRTFMKQLIDLMLNEGRTVFYSTHEMQEAERLARKVAILVDGKVKVYEDMHKLKCKHRKIQAVFEQDTTLPIIPGSCNIRRWDEKVYMDVRDWNEKTDEIIQSSGFENIEILPADLEDVFCMYAGEEE
ncbi:ABC transporter ATP-binding protein [bacterium]|nr:ABC transporter ATP-binding protein [bacterium]